MQETWVRSLSHKDLLEQEMAPHSSILTCEIPWTEEPEILQSMGSQRVGQDLATKQPPPPYTYTSIHTYLQIHIYYIYIYIYIISGVLHKKLFLILASMEKV